MKSNGMTSFMEFTTCLSVNLVDFSLLKLCLWYKWEGQFNTAEPYYMTGTTEESAIHEPFSALLKKIPKNAARN